MYHVLLVDDEKMVREGILASVSWENYGIQDIYQAENGEEALNLFKKYKIQIVITDVKMPIMDGLQLICKLREISPSVKIIVISGYSDYEYLKEAIRLNVLSYILKPIDSLELDGILASTVSALEHEKAGSQILWEGKNLLRQNTLMRLLDGKIDSRELREKSEQLGIVIHKGPFQVALLRLAEQITGKEREILQFAISNMANEILMEDAKGFAFECNDEFTVFLFDAALSEESYHKLIRPLLKLTQEKGIYICIERGAVVNEIDEIAYSYADAREKLIGKPNTEQKYCKLVQDLLVYIEEHFKEDILLKEIAELFYVNASYLGSLFKKEYGKSFIDCVNEYRLRCAREQLEKSNLKVYEIAELVGFKETRYFARLFKAYYGEKPSQIRKN